MEFKNFDNLYRKQKKLPLSSKLFNYMKNQCGESVGFSFRAALWFRQ